MKAFAFGVGLGVLATAIAGQGILAFTVGPLFLGTAFFSALLSVPLLLGTVIHPEIAVQEEGLYLKPLLWRRHDRVLWEHIAAIVPHPLLYDDPAMGKTLHGRNYRVRRGVVIVLAHGTPVLPLYRLVGSVAGLGLIPAFAISTTTLRDYDVLLEMIQQRTGLAVKSDPPVSQASP
ncbi:MAG TPA: hypothetical protein VMT34_04735 [Aggregatilineales bacterium]|nr:hypothetical protein [Aggregatilineales bacterium]